MAVTSTSFLAQTRFAAFADVDEGNITAAIARAENRTNRSAWASTADDGVDLLTAHMLTMDARAASSTPATSGGAGARGPMTSESVGPLSRSFAAPASVAWTDAWLAQTGWGAEYLSLRSLVFACRVV